MTGRRIIITKHAGERIGAHGFTPEEITRAIHDGGRIPRAEERPATASERRRTY